MAWWYALLVVIGLALVAGLAFLAALVATRDVRKPLRLVTEEAEGASTAAAVEVVPLSGPPEVKRLTAAVNRLAGQSSRAQRAEQSFLLSVSHELKTPLTSLRGYGEGLKDGALEPADAGEVIVAESSRLERFVQDLLDSARFGRSEFSVRRRAGRPGEPRARRRRAPRVAARDFGVELRSEGDVLRGRARRPRPCRPGRLEPGRERGALHAGWGHGHGRGRAGRISRRGHRARAKR